VVPKNLAIDKADRLAVIVAPALMLFYRLMSVFATVIEGSARGLTRLLGVKASHRGGGHSSEELKLIVSSSRFAGSLPELQEDMIHRVLDLDDLSVREIMTPRREIVSVSSGSSLDDVLKTMVESQHSRLPVWEDKPEQIVGAVFFKDMLRLWHERRAALRAGRPGPLFHLRHIMRKPLIVPETKPIMQMLEDFRQRHSHMAMVVDEFGTVTGLLTVEDVLEQIVGEIEDEFDEKLPEPRAEADRVNLDGATSILDLSSIYEIDLPANAGFETIAGYMLFKLGHIPRAGEQVEFEGRRFTVAAMERNRIARVRVEKIAPAAESKTGETGAPQVAGH
jgi:CBS domain containing-hemolysin-like protein